MYFTTLTERKNILCFESHRVSSILENNGGINLQNANIIDLKKLLLKGVMSPFYNTKVDIIIVHLYQIREHYSPKYEYTLPFPKNIECDSFIIDMMGESFHGGNDDINNIYKFEDEFSFKCNHKKIVGVFETTDTIEVKGFEIFKYDFSSLFFIGPHNDTFQNWTPYKTPLVYLGSEMVDVKDKVFQCLNNYPRPHRIVLVERMLKSDKIWDYGIISSKPGNYQDRYFSPLIKIDDVVENGTEERFGLQTQFSNKCYIDVVTETAFDYQFITEKSLKPFYLLQFPIIFGYSGIIQYFRDKGFDMFDDIIDHSYDKLDSNQCSEKADAIVTELERLCSLDWDKIYSENKDKLKQNQSLLNKYNFESKRSESIVRFMFGDNYTFTENDKYIKEYVS